MNHPASLTRKSDRAGGFTLIELLIVVAIIAILAAIAVPNFLLAQTRAKTSRAKADMRTVATALESYRVDNNRYPLAYNPSFPCQNYPAAPGCNVNSTSGLINPRLLRLLPLTTPISYITSIPMDVFNQETAATSPSAATDEQVRAFIYTDRFSYGEFVPAPYAATPTSNGHNLYRYLWGPNGEFPGAEWFLRSRGPLGTGSSADGANLGGLIDSRVFYDPTNGVVSNGNIFMLGPGVGFPGQD